MDGFSLHATVHCRADEHQVLEQRCRYFTGTALANGRCSYLGVDGFHGRSWEKVIGITIPGKASVGYEFWKPQP
jgi:hypothetical protein